MIGNELNSVRHGTGGTFRRKRKECLKDSEKKKILEFLG
jgi:hypothetical protein